MSITVGVRFRPVDEDNRPSGPARDSARARWDDTLSRWPGVVSSAFEPPADDPPIERAVVRAQFNHVPPVDLTIVFDTGEHADTLFGNSELIDHLIGVVAGPHAVHTVGQPQANGTPAEDPALG
jgi:hypothetical protein